jgi:hypothetical protein
MIFAPDRCLPPIACWSAFALALFAFKLLKTLALYRTEVRASAAETAGALVAGLALVHVVGIAVIAGLIGRRARFCRTPKLAARHRLAGALAAALPETLLAVGLLGSAVGVAATTPLPSVDSTLWIVLLAASAIPHFAALTLSLLGAVGPGAARRAPARELPVPLTEVRSG